MPPASDERHRPLAQVRSRSIASAAVTATGTICWAASSSGMSSSAASRQHDRISAPVQLSSAGCFWFAAMPNCAGTSPRSPSRPLGGQVEEEDPVEPLGPGELRRQLRDVVGGADEEDVGLVLGQPSEESWIDGAEAGSSENLADRLAAMGDGDRPAGAVVDRHLRVDAQALVDRRANVGGAHRPVLDVGRLRVGRAVDRAAPDAGAGEAEPSSSTSSGRGRRLPLTRGVRPISLMTTTSVSSSRPSVQVFQQGRIGLVEIRAAGCP